MTSTNTYQGLVNDCRKSSKVLKPPGGGSSDIFGAAPEETSPRRIKAHNQSQLGSALFGSDANGTDGAAAVVSPRSNKPGNDSYKRLFGPPDAPPPTTPNARNHMRSNIPLSGGSTASLLSPGAMMSPAKSMSTSSSVISNSPPSVANGFAGNGLINDVTGGAPCLPARNPVTGDGIEVTPIRRILRKYRDGNPVTGTGYATENAPKNGPVMQNGIASSNSSIGSEKSNDTSPSAKPQTRTRVPPGGYSSGLW